MSNEFKHKDAGTALTRTEDNAVDRHEADGETANDMIYFNGTSWIRATPATIRTLLSIIAKTLFDANTILKADSDNTPIALAIAEQRIVGRITDGNIAALTAAQVRTLLSISNVEDTAHSTDAHTMTIDGVDVSAHAANTTTAHGAVSTATASKIVVRDASARAKFAQAAATGDAIVADANVRAPNSTLLEGSSKATVQDHTPKAHGLDSHSAATLANLNADISDATLVDTGDIILKAFIAAKGDVISASGNDTPLILTVGANDTVLTADSSEATGLKWATAAGGAALTVPAGTGTQVYNAAAPTTWTDLILSGTIGEQTTLVMLKAECTTAGLYPYVAFRKNGDTDDLLYNNTIPTGVAMGKVFQGGFMTVSLVATDTSGVIEWKCQAADTIVLDVMAYIK